MRSQTSSFINISQQRPKTFSLTLTISLKPQKTMKEEFLKLPLLKDEAIKRFELAVDGHIAFIDYEEDEKIIKLIHTESPEALAGRGAATALIEKTLIYLEENDYQLIPLCPLVFAYVKRHPEWKRLVPSKYLKLFDR